MTHLHHSYRLQRRFRFNAKSTKCDAILVIPCSIHPNQSNLTSLKNKTNSLTWMFMERHGRVLIGYGWLSCVVRVQAVTWVGVLISPSPLIPLPSRERGYMVGVVLFTRVTLSPCGYCLKASMTGRGGWYCLVSPSPLIPLPSRERGILSVGLACCMSCPALHLWIAGQVWCDALIYLHL